ncbi:MAG: hypothetical protein K9L22_09125 [Methylococcaceae bacterium]|nr:hypothetical protein [Methylococcaceae bacterium]
MKLVYTPIAIALLFAMQTAHADLVSDGELIMDGAQKVYPQFFPSQESTQVLEPWRFRFYPETGVYVGVNQQDSGVYLLGGAFGDSPFYVDKADAVLTLINNQLGTAGGSDLICDTSTVPDGFSYSQSGNTINVTTNGQCIKVADTSNYCDVNTEKDANGVPVATNIHVLMATNITNFELQGISFPGFDDIIKQQMTNQKVCIIHAPTEFTNYTVNMDVCMDITDTLSGSGIPMSGPITTHLVGSSDSTRVNDCFATDASVITNIVTKESWVKGVSGGFTKIN